MTTDPKAALAAAVAALPGGGETRDGQRDMAAAVTDAFTSHRHLVVQAGTGTGKSLAYLVPAICSGERVVVATATKALQDQLATKDLPALAASLGVDFEWAVLKGRSNYVCLQRVREVLDDGQGSLELDDISPTIQLEVRKIARWAGETDSGDRAELSWEPDGRAWSAISVSAAECPGATRCPMGDACFTESARRRAAAAQIVVTNIHLYGLDIVSDGALLPDHDLVVIDEAHQLEDIISDTSGMAIGPTRFTYLARLVRAIVADDSLVGELALAGSRLAAELTPFIGKRLPLGDLAPVIADSLIAGRAKVEAAVVVLRAIDTQVTDANQRRVRAMKAATTLLEDIDAALRVPPSYVLWVEGPVENARLLVAPLDVGPLLNDGLWSKRTAVLTSATIPIALPERVGLPADDVDVLDVGSPFEYETNALLYCAAHLPDPRAAGFDAAVHEELRALITAAGGRTLALFTSWRAMYAAVDALRDELPYLVLTQADLPKPALLDAFRADESSCLFATAGLFQGVDIPGAALHLVTLDRIPFPRPDEPLLEARRERAGPAAFRTVDLPRAATLLAQAAGRLIRSTTDRGVVAVFDPRLATAGYRWDLVRALPAMRRTKDREEAQDFLRRLADDRSSA
ncbi:MAG: ATP-dependent DNA helicase [Acidimicrobiales bacterium]